MTARKLLARGERRAQILATAASAFSRQGYVATSVDDVARAAGITKLIVYRHFESKAELYRAILEDVSARLAEEWEASTDEEHQQGGAVATLLTVAREQPDGFSLLFVHASREAEFAGFADDFRALQEAVADRMLGDLISAGPFRR